MKKPITKERIKRVLKRHAERLVKKSQLFWLWIFWSWRKHFQAYRIKIAGLYFNINDPRSFYNEFKLIFADEIYSFRSENDKPLIIDGGGFIGAATLYFKKKYPQAEIISFEPDSQSASLLERNIADNVLTRVTVIKSGLSDRNGAASFVPNDTDGNRIDENGSSTIEIRKLSDFIAGRKIDFMKLNIEGSELAVCRDLDSTGNMKNVSKMCIEWHSFRGQPQNLDAMLSLLVKNGFRYYINGLPGAPKGKFSAKAEDQFYLMVFAEKNHD